jgi:plasmid maintenance system killer protein
VLRIDFYISPTTIELENSRNPDTLSLDELLYWTFETRINFIEDSPEKSLLSVPEAALFQILNGLSSARKQIRENEQTEITIRDREGSYDLVIKQKGENIKIRDDFGNERFQVTISDFLESTEIFIQSTIKEVEEKFPKLALNKNYQDLKTAFLNSLS